MADYELARSIIHKCPAIKLPQSFVEKLGMTAQIVPMHCDEVTAAALVARLNAAAPAQAAPTAAQVWTSIDRFADEAGSFARDVYVIALDDLRKVLPEFTAAQAAPAPQPEAAGPVQPQPVGEIMELVTTLCEKWLHGDASEVGLATEAVEAAIAAALYATPPAAHATSTGAAWGRLYTAANAVTALAGYRGEVPANSSEIASMQDALHDLDGGQWCPGLEPAPAAHAVEQQSVERDAARWIPPEIAAIVERLHTQDNRITESPLFAVQQRRQYVGSENYNDAECQWVDSDGSEADDEEAGRLDAEYKRTFTEPDGWRRLHVFPVWEFVTGCLTEQGCKDFIACNGHNLHEPRIYAYGSYRNAEWIALRKWLMGLRVAALAPKEQRS